MAWTPGKTPGRTAGAMAGAVAALLVASPLVAVGQSGPARGAQTLEEGDAPEDGAGPPPPGEAELLARIKTLAAPEVGGAEPLIVGTAGPVRGWLAVAVFPPYREFPSVVLFRRLPSGEWQRLLEGLLPGVQPQPSTVLDLHTGGEAFDYTIAAPGRPVSRGDIDKTLEIARQQRLAISAHRYFLHSHPAGAELYFVDRTATYALARRLFPGAYERFPRAECTMFDVSPPRRLALEAQGRQWVLNVETENNQLWTFRWTGADERGLLLDKTVQARPLATDENRPPPPRPLAGR